MAIDTMICQGQHCSWLTTAGDRPNRFVPTSCASLGHFQLRLRCLGIVSHVAPNDTDCIAVWAPGYRPYNYFRHTKDTTLTNPFDSPFEADMTPNSGGRAVAGP